jgi:hypothetical protein
MVSYSGFELRWTSKFLLLKQMKQLSIIFLCCVLCLFCRCVGWLFLRRWTMMFFANFHTIEIRSTIDKNVAHYQISTQKMRTINLCYYKPIQRTSCVFFVFCVFCVSCVSSSSWWDDVKKEVMMHTTKILQQSLLTTSYNIIIMMICSQ